MAIKAVVQRILERALGNRAGAEVITDAIDANTTASAANTAASGANTALLDVTPGTAEASKALVLDANREVTSVVNIATDKLVVGDLWFSGTNSVTAAGSTQGSGGDLAAGINIVSGADNTKCVDLPTAGSTGQLLIVISATAAKTLPMFPATGEVIDGAGANNAVTLASATGYSTCILVSDGTQWYTILGDSV